METTQLHRGRLIDHIQLVVRDITASQNFYTAVLAVLDIPIVTTADGYFWADELVVSSADSPAALGVLTGRHHLAFQAKDRATVDAFYRAAHWKMVGRITVLLASALIIPITMRLSCSTPMAITLRPCIMERRDAAHPLW